MKIKELKARREKAQKYLSSPFAKGWLNKMQYTIKESEAGEKYLFLAILAGYKKLSQKSFQRLVEAIYTMNFDDEFCMSVWIGGSVNWTMLYSQPFTHVNGSETYFCHGVAEDDYSPEDWERDMAIIKANKNGEPVTAYDYISYLFAA